MSEGKFYTELNKRKKENYPKTATDGYILIPYDVTRLLDGAKKELEIECGVHEYLKRYRGVLLHLENNHESGEAYRVKEIIKFLEWIEKWFGE